MLKHADIWTAIDRLAQNKGLSPSGLARSAGLDPTTFNRSKRITREGKARWPSTESVSKILAATDTTLSNFVGLVNKALGSGERRTIPFTSLATMRSERLFDLTGHPVGDRWDEIAAPDINDAGAFAVEITGSEFEPVFRDGDVLIASPGASPRRGDRILALSTERVVVLGLLLRQTAKRLDYKTLDGSVEGSVGLGDLVCLTRILWASQ